MTAAAVVGCFVAYGLACLIVLAVREAVCPSPQVPEDAGGYTFSGTGR